MKEILIYKNELKTPIDVKDWIKEGNINIQSDEGVIFEGADDVSLGDKAHWNFWIPQTFPENIKIKWQFRPLNEPGLCMIFFAAKGINGESIFADNLQKRDGHYPQYHSGDIDTYHLSYFRRKWEDERGFHTCNLRKSKGFHLVAQGADPIPSVEDVNGFYEIEIVKYENMIYFSVNDLLLFTWYDDGESFGEELTGGHIGFRQMTPMKAEYKNLEIYEIEI